MMTSTGAKKHFWVPPPALTSPGKKVDNRRSKSPKRKPQETKRTGSTDNHSSKSDKVSAVLSDDFVDQLEKLLDEIRRVKSQGSVLKEISDAGDVQGTTAPIVSVERRLSDRERLLLQKSIGLVKDELLKSVSESAVLSDRHALLVEKLRRIEEDAGEAVRHVASLRHFFQQLSQEEATKSRDSATQLEKRKELLIKLSRLDDANRSLHNLIGGIATVDEQQEPIAESFSQNFDEIDRQKSEIKSLQERLLTDRQEILGLKAALNEATTYSNIEKQSLQTEIRAHRERANKYLADFDIVRLELNEKTDKLNNLVMELDNQRLSVTRLTTKNSRLQSENVTLRSKLEVIESQVKMDDSSVRAKMNDMESNFHRMSSRATVLELENSKLKLALAGMQSVLSRQKSEMERLENDLDNSSKFTRNTRAKKHKSVQHVDSSPEKSAGDGIINVPSVKAEEVKWIKVTELHEIVEKEKAIILQQFKDLETKLDQCEVLNETFRKQLTEKEEIVLQNNLKLQERMTESNTLKESLEVALKDVRKLTDETKRTQTLDQRSKADNKLNELEGMVLRYRNESEQIRKQKDQLERKLTLEIEEVRRQLESVRSANRTLQEYVRFLRSSYADVFGECYLRAAAAATSPT